MTECVTCGRPVDGAYLCSSCTDGLAKDLSEITALDADLAITYARQSRISRNVGARSDVRPLPWDERAAKHRAAIKATLVAIVRDLHDGLERWPSDALEAMVLWLLGRLDRIRQQEAADETVSQVHDLIEQGNRICSGPALVIYAGPCQGGQLDDDGIPTGETCGASLYVDASWDEKTEQHKPIDKPIECGRCGAVTEARAQREYLLAEIDGMLVPMETAAKLLSAFGDDDLPSATVRSWKARGELVARSIDREANELFLVSDVRALHERRQARRAERKARA